MAHPTWSDIDPTDVTAFIVQTDTGEIFHTRWEKSRCSPDHWGRLLLIADTSTPTGISQVVGYRDTADVWHPLGPTTPRMLAHLIGIATRT